MTVPVTAGSTLSVVVGPGGVGQRPGAVATDGGATLVRKGFTVFASAAGGRADGSGGSDATDKGDRFIVGNAGSPGSPPSGDFGLGGGAGGAGGTPVGRVSPDDLGRGGPGGRGQGVTCSSKTPTGIPTGCNNSGYSWQSGFAGSGGAALIIW